MNTKAKISKALKELGIPANIKGYQYIRCAVELAIEDAKYMRRTTDLYCEVGKMFNDKYPNVERAIRHAIEMSWNRANVEFVNELFGYTVDANKGKPTNGEFIATVVDYILMMEDEGK